MFFLALFLETLAQVVAMALRFATLPL